MSNLGDVKEKAIKIKLDKERTLRFDLNAMAELEEKFGDIQAVFGVMQNQSMKGIRTVLWAALVHEDESLTEKRVGQLIDFNNLGEVMEAISQALGVALPNQEAPATI